MAVTLNTIPDPSHLQLAFQTLLEHPCHASLTELSLREWNQNWPSSSQHTITGGTFGPLLDLRNLRVVKISLSYYYALDDSFIRNLAVSWPHLENLDLLPSWSALTDSSNKITAGGLVPLAIHCPKLVRLSLSFDATHIPFPYHEQVTLGFSCSLKSLDVSHSPITNPPLVAAFLSGLFRAPAVSGSGEYGDRWNEVLKLITYFDAVREQERYLASIRDYSFRLS